MSSLCVCLCEPATRSRRFPFVLNDLTGKAFDLVFSSALPGGMMACSFSLLMRPAEAQTWYETNHFKGILISEGGGITWEGRISHVSVTNSGVDVVCDGYWASMADQHIYAWYADNQMNNWITPSPGAGGISDDISLAGAGVIDKFQVGTGNALFRIGVTKDMHYELGDRAVFYYELPDISNLTDDRPFGPLTIHSIQFTWDMSAETEQKAAWNLKVWSADKILGTWTEALNIDIRATTPRTYSVNIAADGVLAQAVAIGVETIFPFDAVGENSEHRILIKDLTIYAERDATDARKTTAKKIIVDLLGGNSDVLVDAHADQVMDDEAFIEDTDLEIVPASFSGRTLQEIASELVDFGFSQVANLVDNPSVENDGVGWSGPTGLAIPPGSHGLDGFVVGLTNATGEGVTIVQRDGKRFPVDQGSRYTFSIDLKTSAAIALDINLNWFGKGDTIFALKGGSPTSALKETSTHGLKDINAGISTTTKKKGVTALDFERVSVTAKAPDDTTHVQLEVLTPSPQAMPNVTVDAARLIKGEIATYIDGDQPRGAWEGVVHESQTVQFVPPILGVFGNRTLQLRGRDERRVKWLVTTREFGDSGFQLQKNMIDFYTRAWADYSEAFTGKEKFQDVVKSIVAEELFYNERDFILNLQGVTGTVAGRVTKAFGEDHDQLQQRMELEMTGAIANSLGAREPLWRVRAGDLMMITDLGLAPVLRSLQTDTIDQIRTFLIKEAEYSVGTNSLTITPDFPLARMDLILARLNVTPSLVASGQIFGRLNPLAGVTRGIGPQVPGGSL